MKLLRPLIIVTSLLATTGVATAAIKAGTFAAARVVLDTGAAATVSLSSATGVGIAKATSKTGGGAVVPTPVDVRFPVDLQSDGVTRALSFLSGAPKPFDAKLKLLDVNHGIKHVIDLGQANIIEVELPGANARDGKKSLELRMRLQPSLLNVVAGSGTQAAPPLGKAKTPLLSNFRVSLDGVASPNVLAVSPCVVRRGGQEITGLGVTLPLSDGLTGDWWKWAQASLGTTKDAKVSEKTLKIEYLDPTLANVMFTMSFSGARVTSIDVATLTSNEEKMAEVSYGLAARSVQLK